jgi:hypothetical protein
MTGLRPPTRGGPAPPGMAAEVEVGVEVVVEVGGPRRRGRDDVKEQVAASQWVQCGVEERGLGHQGSAFCANSNARIDTAQSNQYPLLSSQS